MRRNARRVAAWSRAKHVPTDPSPVLPGLIEAAKKERKKRERSVADCNIGPPTESAALSQASEPTRTSVDAPGQARHSENGGAMQPFE